VSAAVLWAVLLLALAVIAVRRRSVAIVLTGAQSLILGGQALSLAGSRSSEMLVAGALLVVKGVAVPILLWLVMRRTRETTALLSEPRPAVRVVLAVAPALLAALLMPDLGLSSRGAQDTAVALLMLGIACAAVRRAALFQALGFLIAENGLYVAALGQHSNVPPVIELGLGFDLVLVVTVAVAFSAHIHRAFGSSDTGALGTLHD
jgi:hydrogenase-4 component E